MTAALAGRNLPQRITRCLLVLFLFGICSRGYGDYSQTLKNSPQVWNDVLNGTADAPEQYRIGVMILAHWMSEYLHLGQRYLRLSEAFWLLDLLGSMLAVLLLYGLLVRTKLYLEASNAAQWFGSAAFLALTLYLVDWVNWYQKVSTLPVAGIVAGMFWLWTSSAVRSSGFRQVLLGVTFLAMSAVLSTMRADVAVAVCVGIFLASAIGLSPYLALQRGAAMLCSLAGALLAGAVQLYLMKVRYPRATYGQVHAFMLAHDWWRVQKWIYCLIFMAPFLWTLTQAARRRYFGEGAEGAFLIAAMVHAGMWLVMGRLDEVRIFLPMALAITPLTVQLGMLRLDGAATVKQTQSLPAAP